MSEHGRQELSSEEVRLSETYRLRGMGGRLDPGPNVAVLVVDFINGFTDPAYPTGFNCDQAVDATAGLLAMARAAGRPVIFTTIVLDAVRQAHSVWCMKMPALRCLTPDSPSVLVDARLGPNALELLITKSAASSFTGTDLAAVLVQARIDTLLVCGATTSGCVRATVVDACMAGFRSIVVRECVADRGTGPHEANLFDIQAKYGEVIDLAAAWQLLRGAAA